MAVRRAGLGFSGGDDSALTTGTRDAVRAGHQAAPVAVITASSMPAAIRSHGTANLSMRCPANDCRYGAATNHASRPATTPATAAMAPTSTPLTTMTVR